MRIDNGRCVPVANFTDFGINVEKITTGSKPQDMLVIDAEFVQLLAASQTITSNEVEVVFKKAQSSILNLTGAEIQNLKFDLIIDKIREIWKAQYNKGNSLYCFCNQIWVAASGFVLEILEKDTTAILSYKGVAPTSSEDLFSSKELAIRSFKGNLLYNNHKQGFTPAYQLQYFNKNGELETYKLPK